MPHVTPVSKREQFKRLIAQDKLTVFMYYTQWCYYCKLFHPTFDELVTRKEFAGIQFCTVDCTKDTKDIDEISQRAKANGYPHIAVFRGNRLLSKKSGNNELGTMKVWLGDCITASKVPSSSNQHKKPSRHIDELHRMKKRGELLFTQYTDFDDIYTLATEHKHVVVGFYKKARPNASRSMWAGISQATAKPEFDDIRWVSFNCDEEEDVVDDWLLDYQSRCWFFRDGVMFCEWRGTGTDTSCEKWLSDCLIASKIADTVPAAHYEDEEVDEDTDSQDASGQEGLDSDVEGGESEQADVNGEGEDNEDTEEDVQESEETDDEEEGEEEDDEDDDEDEDEDEEDDEEDEEEEEEDLSGLSYISSLPDWQSKLSDHKTVVVTFYDSWNPYAQASLVILEGVATSEVYPSIAFCAISRDDNLAETLRNINCPEIRIIRSGSELTKVERTLDYDELKGWIEEHVEDAKESLGEVEEDAQQKQEAATEQSSAVEDTSKGHTVDVELVSPSSAFSHTSDPPIDLQMGRLNIGDDKEAVLSHANGSSSRPASNIVMAEQALEETVLSTPMATISPKPVPASGAAPWLQVENHSITSLNSISTSSTATLRPLTPCTGLHQDRPKSRLRFLGRRKPFHDPEPGCVFVPTEDGEGLQIGRANEGASYFNVTLSYTHAHEGDSKAQLSFGLGFGPDPTERDRFVSAVFRVTFGYDDEDGKHQHLKIRDLAPKDEKGESSEVKWGRGSEGSLSLSLGYSSVSLGGESKRSKNAEYVRKTSARVRGQGIHTPTAEWTFAEDEGEAGRHGLDPQYELSVTLPEAAAHRIVWMEFWGKAVLARGRSLTGLDVTLKVGDEDEPFRRNVDLNSGVSIAK